MHASACCVQIHLIRHRFLFDAFAVVIHEQSSGSCRDADYFSSKSSRNQQNRSEIYAVVFVLYFDFTTMVRQ